jgi:hypothetical protein
MATFGRTKTFTPKVEKPYESLTIWEKFIATYAANFKKLSEEEKPVWREFVDKSDGVILERAMEEVTAEHERQCSSGYQVKSPSLPRIKAAYWGIFKQEQKKQGNETFSGRSCGKCSTRRRINGEMVLVPTGRVRCVCEVATGKPLYPGKVEAFPAVKIGEYICPCSCDAGKDFPLNDGQHISNRARGEFARCAFGAGGAVPTTDVLDYMESCDAAYQKTLKDKQEGKEAGLQIPAELQAVERKIEEKSKPIKNDAFYGAVENIEAELSEMVQF